MKFIYILLIILNIFSFNSCLFKNSKHIKELPNVATLDSELKNSNITIGMMLIYSVHCGHCHTFAETYEKIAEKYNQSMLFFAMKVNTDYHKRMPSTWGVPYILFFSDGYFYQHKRRRSFDEISRTIEKYYLTRCREITYNNIENVYYNVFMNNEKKYYNNLIIGYFDENSNNDIENFKMSTNLMCPECVGLCYICKDFNENKNTNNTLLKYIKSHIIVGYLHNNNSKIFLWDSKNKNNSNDIESNDQLVNNDLQLENFNPVIHKYYEDFINNDLKLDYFNIDKKEKIYIINFLRNKNNLFFSYLTNEEKQIYENNINELIKISDKKLISFYNLVLYNYTEVQDDKLEYIKAKGIYEINQELNLTNEYNNFEEIKNKIIKEIDNNKTQHEINNVPLIPEVKKEEKDLENQNPNNILYDDLFFKFLEKICVVLFTIVITFAVFFGIHYKYYNKVDKELIYWNNKRKSK